ncbi:MAG TPA: IclR family transcriptional regulator [Patescibacteria group bacterium]|nr:IclR family transcriptional regulator [Patescibacteria group bacterium]
MSSRDAGPATAAASAGRGSRETSAHARYGIRVLDRACSLLAILSDGSPRNLVQLSTEADLNTTTTFRILASLLAHSFVARNQQSGEYSLGLACLELAHAFLGNGVRSLALPHLLALREETRETVHLAVLDRMEVVYVEKLDALHAIGLMSSHVGGRKPAYCTGVGKALLAFQDPALVREHHGHSAMPRLTNTTITTVDALMDELAEVKARGYAFDRGENEPEVRCVAVPVFDAAGHPVAAISVAGPATRMDPIAENEDVVGKATSAAERISAALGFRPDVLRARADGSRYAVNTR